MDWKQNFFNKIICGDCLKLMKELPDRCVNLVLTSPPYNVGTNYDMAKDSMPFDDYIDWLVRVFCRCAKLLTAGGHILIQLANTGRQPYLYKTGYLIVALNKTWNLQLRGEIIWNKQNCTSPTAWGSWLSPNQPSIRDRTERIIVYRKEGKRKGITDLTRDEFLLWTQDIWNISPETRRAHPAPFPVKLAYRCIKLFSFIDEIVLDPFIGSGTTATACKKLNRNFIGFEISPKYCQMAKNRLSEIERSLFQRC